MQLCSGIYVQAYINDGGWLCCNKNVKTWNRSSCVIYKEKKCIILLFTYLAFVFIIYFNCLQYFMINYFYAFTFSWIFLFLFSYCLFVYQSIFFLMSVHEGIFIFILHIYYYLFVCLTIFWYSSSSFYFCKISIHPASLILLYIQFSLNTWVFYLVFY